MRFQVVESRTFGLAQHDPFTWRVEQDHLVRADGIYQGRKRMDNTLNQWILSLDEEQLKVFVDTLYQVISASKADNLIDLTAGWKVSMTRIVAALKEVDDQTTEILKRVIRSLFEIAAANRKRETARKVSLRRAKRQSKLKPFCRKA